MAASYSELTEIARQLRAEAIKALFGAQSGHPGSSMSVMDWLVFLYFGGGLRYDAKNPRDPSRDRFILSNGHACPALYAVLARAGYFPAEETMKLRELGAGVQGHPHYGALPGIETTSGSLGQGLSVGIGMALMGKREKKDFRVAVMMSDGEQQEGSTWEAVMFAAKAGLGNLTAIVDANGMQIDGSTKKVMPSLEPLAEKYRAFGWETAEIDGGDFPAIKEAWENRPESGKPYAIISRTVRGRGVSFMEGSEHWHAGALTEEQYRTALTDLEKQ